MHYSLKAKCQGCVALKHANNEFTCHFELPLIVEESEGRQFSPQPNEVKCYKPKSIAEFNEAKNLMAKKADA